VTGLRIGLCGVHEYASAPLLDFLELAEYDLTIRIDDNNPLSLYWFRLNGGAIRLPRVGFCFGGGCFLGEKIKGWKSAGVFF
jgi:hypothetical protein